MKKLFFLPLLLLLLMLASCTTYQYSARQVDVNKRNIDANEQRVGIIANYSKIVSATSSYQATRKDAIAEAEFMCIQNTKIDVIVDPILRVEYNPWKVKSRYKATIIGYAGMYEHMPNLLDASKNYTLEDIEKFKLLYDPNFPQYYYNNSASGDNYYFQKGDEKEKKAKFINMFKSQKK